MGLTNILKGCWIGIGTLVIAGALAYTTYTFERAHIEANNVARQQEKVVRAEAFYKAKGKYDAMWEKNSQPITGTVVEENYGVDLIPSEGHTSSSHYGAFGGGSSTTDLESVKLFRFYELKIKTDAGKTIAVNVLDSYKQPKEALDMLIEKGSRVSFPSGTMYQIDPSNWQRLDEMETFGYGRLDDETFFENDTQIGSKRANRIKVLPFSEK